MLLARPEVILHRDEERVEEFLWKRGRQSKAVMEYRAGSRHSCNCLHDTVGGFTRPLERVLSEFLKLYITLQLTTGSGNSSYRIKYTEACIDSPVSSVKMSSSGPAGDSWSHGEKADIASGPLSARRDDNIALSSARVYQKSSVRNGRRVVG